MTTTNRRKEHKESINYNNSSIQRTVNYVNILFEQNKFLKDDGITDFSLFDSSNGIVTTDTFTSMQII